MRAFGLTEEEFREHLNNSSLWTIVRSIKYLLDSREIKTMRKVIQQRG